MNTPTAPRGPCACHTPLALRDFRHRAAYLRWRRDGRCQWCQDTARLARHPTDPDHRRPWPIRQGALVAHDAGLDEVVLLPFLFASPGGAVAWEARYIVRVGTDLAPLDPGHALGAMRTVLEGHLVQVSAAPALDAPLLGRTFEHCALLIGADQAGLFALLDACPALGRAQPVLQHVAFGHRATGAALTLEAFTAHEDLDPAHDPARAPEGLRRCAWLGAALVRPTPDGTLLDQILFGYHGLCAPHAAAPSGAPH